MGTRTSHPPGAFSWADLETSDAAAAKSFYTSVFGWDYVDHPVEDGPAYSIARRDGSDVGALFASDKPPHWNCYVTIPDADAAATATNTHGGRVVAAPVDLPRFGRMVVIADPTGATLCLWEPRGHVGAALVNAPGSLTWNDLATPDPDAAARFYTALLGWSIEELPNAGGYRVIKNGERSNGGIMPLDPERIGAAVPPSWMPYFGHEDIERLTEEIGDLGGRVLNAPTRMEHGSFAVFADPQGAVFAAWTGRYDD